MVSFARSRTRSLLSRIWPAKVQSIKNEIIALEESQDLIDKQRKKNQYAVDQRFVW